MDLSRASFWGYKRENGRVGVRNHVIVLPVDDLSNAAAQAVEHVGLPEAQLLAEKGQLVVLQASRTEGDAKLAKSKYLAGDEVTGQFRLVDLSGTYSDSDPFTLRLRALVSVPAMSGWAVAALASLTIAAGASVLRRVMPAVV